MGRRDSITSPGDSEEATVIVGAAPSAPIDESSTETDAVGTVRNLKVRTWSSLVKLGRNRARRPVQKSSRRPKPWRPVAQSPQIYSNRIDAERIKLLIVLGATGSVLLALILMLVLR